MRQLNTGDAFKLLQIFRAAGVKDDFAELMDLVFARAAREVIGGKMFALLFDCIGNEKTEGMLTKLIADISGKTPAEITEQPIGVTVMMLKEIVKQNDIKGFFGGAASLT